MAQVTRKQSAKKPAVKGRGSKALRVPLPAQSQVRELRNRFGMTQPEFARLLPVSIRSLATLEAGGVPTGPIARRIIELDRLTKSLAQVLKPSFVGSWLQTPNKAFAGLKPCEVIERGEGDRIWQMIYELRSGIAF